MSGKARDLWEAIRRLFRKDRPLPEDPYAYVTAPKRPPLRGRGAAVAEEPER
jgi:hypothetical protein